MMDYKMLCNFIFRTLCVNVKNYVKHSRRETVYTAFREKISVEIYQFY